MEAARVERSSLGAVSGLVVSGRLRPSGDRFLPWPTALLTVRSGRRCLRWSGLRPDQLADVDWFTAVGAVHYWR